MIVGIITGTYSSVFIAAAIVSFWRGTGADARGGPRAGADGAAPQQPRAGRSRSGRRARRRPQRAAQPARRRAAAEPDAER